ncbi:MAG: hypothetical protein ACRCYC_00505 [Paraclostridium sp.]|uniref:hypothetical protein n=1 Tax=Paraclostridium sp. TaxID=2023273 RepID=UPI003F2F0671
MNKSHAYENLYYVISENNILLAYRNIKKNKDSTDEYKNLVRLCYEAHKLVHFTEQDTISKYLEVLQLDEKGLKRLNTLRRLVGNSVI